MSGNVTLMLPMEDRVLLQDTLVSLSVDDTVIEQIMSMLEDQETQLRANPLSDIQPTWFGGSYTGGHRLATNATQANDVVGTEMEHMLAGLREYRTTIKIYAEDFQDTDQSNAIAMASLQNAVDCTDGVPATTCAPPTEDS